MPPSRKSTDTTLIGGPYRPPKFRLGQTLDCDRRGPVVVASVSAAPIPWPLARITRQFPASPVICGDLRKALETESIRAVAHYWGVSRHTVVRWRRELGISTATTAGTRALHRRYMEGLSDRQRSYRASLGGKATKGIPKSRPAKEV